MRTRKKFSELTAEEKRARRRERYRRQVEARGGEYSPRSPESRDPNRVRVADMTPETAREYSRETTRRWRERQREVSRV